MIRRTDTSPEFAHADAATVVITFRHVENAARQQAVAEAAAAREQAAWPDGLVGGSLLTSTDGHALMAYEQWRGDDALDAALSAPAAYAPGVPGTEPSVPVRYRLHRSHVSTVDERRVGCVVTVSFDVEGPERQRHLVDEIFSMTKDGPAVPGPVAGHFHASADGTRLVNYAEWTDEQAHAVMLDAGDFQGVRRRLTQEIPGVRACGWRRWHPHTTLVPGGHNDGR